jgi:putative transposase
MHCWTIMPNHVHAAMRLASGVALEEVVRGWKGRTARAANQFLGRTGRFWQKESYDTLLHDRNDLDRVIAYTENNPVKAGLEEWP